MSNSLQQNYYDVVIIGGGPAGSTAGTLLKKYAPNLQVLILEKEKFPRDHVGESQLPGISNILAEMGCWDKVEAANFPIKIGATYRWGKDPDLWDFDFIPVAEFKDESRPAKYKGQRKITAFQVDRAVYDDILLRHAEELGCEVQEETAVTKVDIDGDRVTALHLSNGQQVTARHYIDGSGHMGVLRRALGVQTDIPTRLQNIAIWDYWTNAEWAEEIGVGGTRVQVMSLSHGWIWFIPLGPTRTSIGFICPAEHYKKLRKRPEEVYAEALKSEPRIANLITNATSRNKIETTKDWSFLAQRMVGENWFLAGESAGFADPILAAGMTLTHSSAREVAYTILELERGKHDSGWLKTHYEQTQQRRIKQHIQFADYWYAANGQFTDLKKHCRDIAKDSGLRLSPDEAFRWLAQGGFTNDHIEQPVIGGFDPGSMKHVLQKFAQQKAKWQIDGFNIFKLNLKGAQEDFIPHYSQGEIKRIKCYVRGNDRLPIAGYYDLIFKVLSQTSDIREIANVVKVFCQKKFSSSQHARIAFNQVFQCLDVLVNEGWVKAQLDKKKPKLTMTMPEETTHIHSHQ
ncbi:MAG: NAD(P)/FAD-dependent oxidoreductase [Okeania sp. SIO2C2]|uniref:NAD(P)/FAD-dependent oxidoreductase n=1 Tax=Okeania sp. SIO2C2 TaxID=2607787 RepID=UPI0013BB7C33|nr:NAD(P)/FAD-dependent oxidoreductase [Okeania sp. SIO2C2]NEP88273.1 NAD(P)/FAD-dependent oxidoreductase [Okeania sp. SIO2C2]